MARNDNSGRGGWRGDTRDKKPSTSWAECLCNYTLNHTSGSLSLSLPVYTGAGKFTCPQRAFVTASQEGERRAVSHCPFSLINLWRRTFQVLNIYLLYYEAAPQVAVLEARDLIFISVCCLLWKRGKRTGLSFFRS